jgi:DNA-binding NtrC family response regulator
VLSTGALDALLRHPWPGNVRELRNTIERLVVSSRGSIIGHSTCRKRCWRSHQRRPTNPFARSAHSTTSSAGYCVLAATEGNRTRRGDLGIDAGRSIAWPNGSASR